MKFLSLLPVLPACLFVFGATACLPKTDEPKGPDGFARAGGSGGGSSTGGRPGSGGSSGSGGSPSGTGGTEAGGTGGSSPGSGGTTAGTGGTGGAGGSEPGPGSGGLENPDAVISDAETEVPPPIMVEPPVFPPITPCAEPSVDHLRVWTAWNPPGGTAPGAGSSILTKEGAKTVAKISYQKCTPPLWCEMVVPVTNSLAGQVDLTKSKGFSMTYSATADLWVQVRPASRYHGGDKWVIKIPSTAGKVETHFFPFLPQAWFWINRLGKPNYPFELALKDMRSFDFVGNTANELVFHGLRIDGHIPACR